MCYAIPGKVKEIQEKIVIVDYFGEERKAYNELDDVKIGDYIYAQGGYAIKKLSANEAEEILALWKEMFFELQEVDLRLSRITLDDSVISKEIRRILDRALEGFEIKKEDVLKLLSCDDDVQLDYLFKTANFLRQKHLKNSCCVHGILEISSFCSQACAYCGISTENKKLKRYRMTVDQIADCAYEAIEKYGFKALVLQSGEDSGYSIDELSDIIKQIKEKFPALIFISFGEIGIKGLQKLFDAGARGLLMRFETSNSELYAKLHPGRTLDTRLEHIRKAYEMGYLILTGGLIGLPGQTKQDILNDIYLTKDLHAEMYSFGPFLPHPETPLAKDKPVNENDVLKVLSLARLVDPIDAKILITTGFETLSPEARKKGLLSGGNSVMLNVTPIEFRKQYDIYPNRKYNESVIQDQIDETISLLGALGRAPTDLSVR
ncbi:HypC/HybG/HupF family hydrogenase formation chaperone [bacterium]|nr:HypC/HybG/HupF family hydrogenase formation chaperone [bacterium]